MGAALSADVDAPTERVVLCKKARQFVNGAVDGCVEAPFLVSGKLSRQNARTTEKMDLRYADAELPSLAHSALEAE